MIDVVSITYLVYFYYALTVLFLVFFYAYKKSRLTSFLSFLALIAYFYWRVAFTIPAWSEGYGFAYTWMWLYLVFEILSLAEVWQRYAFDLRTKAFAPKSHTTLSSANLHVAAVDVLIPTYNEPLDILRKTILFARQIDWNDKTVNVLDDGDRPDVRALCQELGVRYFARSHNKGAKAGNMNTFLQFLTGRYVAILDADFVASKDFLKIGMNYFSEPNVAVVQFPQTFYNSDQTQLNSLMFDRLDDEQLMWYSSILPRRNALNLATSCGSCSIVSREALDHIGGVFPESTITEDFDLSLRLLDLGYYTRYVNQAVAVGLHAETVKDFFKQRRRWAIGNVKALRLALFRRGKLKFVDKLMLFEWRAIGLPARWVTFFAPTCFFLFGLVPLNVDTLFEYLFFTIPFALFLSHTELESRRFNFLDFVAKQGRSVGLSLCLGYEMIKSFLLPANQKFDVTTKRHSARFEYGIYRFLILTAFILSLISAIMGVFQYINQSTVVAVQVSLVWQIWNIVLITFALKMFTMKTFPRKRDRFRLTAGTSVHFTDALGGQVYEADLLDVSESGAAIRVRENTEIEHATIKFSDFSINAIVVASEKMRDGYRIRLKFNDDASALIKIIDFIYKNIFFLRSTRIK